MSALRHRPFQLLQASLEVVQHLQAEHRQFLNGEQEFRSVHLQQFGIGERRGGTEATVIGIDQGSDAETTAWSHGFRQLATPAELNGAGSHTITNIAVISRPEDDCSCLDLTCRSAVGKGGDGRELWLALLMIRPRRAPGREGIKISTTHAVWVEPAALDQQ